MRAVGRLAAWTLGAALALGGARADDVQVVRMRPMLGTFVEITAEAPDAARAARAIEAAFAAVAEVDRLLSSHRADSELSAINAAAGDRAIAVSPWTWECVAEALRVAGESDGAFDPTCRPLLDLWGFVRRAYRLPSRAEVEARRALVDYRGVQMIASRFSPRDAWPAGWLPNERRIGLARKGMMLDLGGIGKGFAADKAVDALRAAGIRSGLVRCWGDLRAFGPRAWAVGVADPAHPDRAVLRETIRDAAFSTSGDYRNFFVVNGRRYSHLLDPRTGWPVRGRRSCSVRASSGALADAWSTALFVNPRLRPPEGVRLLDLR